MQRQKTVQKLTADGHELLISTQPQGERLSVEIELKTVEPCILHWGLSNSFTRVWRRPPESCWPADTKGIDALAVQTPLPKDGKGGAALRLVFDSNDCTGGLSFVMFFPEKKRWIKNGHEDFYVSLNGESADAGADARKLRELTQAIVNAESNSSWTLMHRFNLCHDLIGAAAGSPEALALIFVWLRYSAIRQLAWQRNYNTQPRELAHSQNRLTVKLAGIWRTQPKGRPWIRAMLPNLGRGGEGQQVRDEILNIMHRHHIKEVHGHFIEEWHQKLHNNTTPDDVVICEGFIGFLKSNNVEQFYTTLKNGGVTRERLRSFERPIKSDPSSFGDRNQGLINDFEKFLRILKSLHSGTDFDTMYDAARRHLKPDVTAKLNELSAMRKTSAQMDIAWRITDARELLGKSVYACNDDGALRDLLFLDLSLEAWLRRSIERQDLAKMGRDELAGLLQLTLKNICIYEDDAEFGICARHWAALLARPRDGNDWALHAKSVSDRVGRAVQHLTDAQYSTMQPKAESLGQGFKAEAWTIPLFSEEVIRGGLAFVLSLVLRRLDPVLRTAAGLGGWQVISGGKATGRLLPVPSLSGVQTQTFPEATVLLADSIGGNEEIPEHVTAVLTSSGVDLVSHVAVRARNSGVLFATCFDRDSFERLKNEKDRTLSFFTNARGDVEFTEAAANAQIATEERKGSALQIRRRDFSAWAINAPEFTRENAGGKSNNLNGLRGRVPDWIGFPKSIAMPFGAFEQTLNDDCNREVRANYESLTAKAAHDIGGTLPAVRASILELNPPADLKGVLSSAWERGELPPVPWDETWQTIKRVWASKWNERAYLSRRARGIPDSDLMMSVLIQEVIAAEYAFVIHTVNPMTGNRDEIYAEVVLGMGETLVGNYPGRSLGFICKKSDLSVQLLSYPGKSVGLYGSGVIFRSDSNGEDLENFAGAGLYDSHLARDPEHRLLDYSSERLIWDCGFRDALLKKVAGVGLEVERVCGSAQDVEGAVSGGKFFVVQTRSQVGLHG